MLLRKDIPNNLASMEYIVFNEKINDLLIKSIREKLDELDMPSVKHEKDWKDALRTIDTMLDYCGY